MNLGQLFVSLGVKVAGDTKKTQEDFLNGIRRVKASAYLISKKIGHVSGFSDFSQGLASVAKGNGTLVSMFARMITAANLARAAIIGVVAAMVKLTMNAAEASEHLFKFSINTGMDTTALQKWQQQAGMAGVQAEDVANSFKEMQRKAMEIQLGQADAGSFQMAGVNWTSDAETMMAQIEAMLKSRPAAMGTKLAADMGLSEDMIAFLRMRSSMPQAKEGLILSPDEIADLKDFSMEMTGSLNTLKMALVKVGAMIAPITKPLIYGFKRVMDMLADFTAWFNTLGKWKAVILGVGTAIAIALTAAFFPITATVLGVIALLAGAFLVVEDIYTFMQGGESFTGDLLTATSEGIKGAITGAFSSAIDWVKENWKVLVQWMADELGNIFSTIFDGIRMFGEVLVSIIEGIANILGMSKLFNGIGDATMEGAGKLGEMWGNVKNFFSPTTTPMAIGAQNLAGAGAGVGSVTQSINIQVDGTKDPKAVSEEISTRLKRETTNAVFQMPRQEK
jgi:hypothetical protein